MEGGAWIEVSSVNVPEQEPAPVKTGKQHDRDDGSGDQADAPPGQVPHLSHEQAHQEYRHVVQ